MGAEKHTFLMVLGIECSKFGHVNASHGLVSDIFTGLAVIVISPLKLLRMFFGTSVR